VLRLGVNAEARRFSEPGAGIPHAGIFGGAGGQLPVLRYLGNTAPLSVLPQSFQLGKKYLENLGGVKKRQFLKPNNSYYHLAYARIWKEIRLRSWEKTYWSRWSMRGF